MASKLFKAVVGFGIALGAANAACSAPAGEDSATSEAAQTASYDDGAADAAPNDPFCEVAWPTTKCGPSPIHQMACIDPKEQCGPYPGQICWSGDDCAFTTPAGSCDLTRPSVWKVCKVDSGGPGWACPSGTVPRASCALETETR